MKGCKTDLTPYRDMGISMSARSKIFKKFAVSKYNHQALTNGFIKRERRRIEGIAGSFIWAGRNERIARKQLHNKVEDGGLDLKNLECEEVNYRSKYLRRLQDSNHPAKELGEMVLGS